jgi:isopenicillin N synthase-like dioxygenase
MTGGLQTLTREEGWLDVKPEAGTIVVNFGDAMQVWANDVYRVAVHRVVPMTQNTRTARRISSTPQMARCWRL